MRNLIVNVEDRVTEVVIDDFPNFDSELNSRDNKIIVTDENLSEHELVKGLTESGYSTVVLKSGETYKNLDSIEKIVSAALQKGLDRGGLIVGVGGGVVCDMAAFASSVYMRGCGLMLAPTSLLSMVDASIGGKTGVDFQQKKNLIGSFYPAAKVLVYTEFLKTLSADEYRSGLAEIIKHGFLAGAELLAYIEENKEAIMNRDAEKMIELIYLSLKIKAEYIEKDFREQGIRAHLNLGHTFGHALESAAGLGKFTHGEAVAWGMNKALQAGVLAGITDEAYAAKAEKILRDFEYNLDFDDFNRDLFLAALSSDKKKKEGRLRFIIQKELGATVITGLDSSIITEVIK